MGALHLDGLEIEGFRCFEKLELPDLGRVNLITGANSVGKSCVLEALELWAARGSLEVAVGQLVRREELPPGYLVRDDSENPGLLRERFEALRSLFHNWPALETSPAARVGGAERALAFGVGWPGDASLQERFGKVQIGDAAQWVAEDHEGWWSFGRLDAFFRGLGVTGSRLKLPPALPCTFYTFAEPRAEELVRWWDQIALTDEAEQVLAALSRVVGPVKGLNFSGARGGTVRVPEVRVERPTFPVPVRTLGDGVGQVLGSSLALAGAKGGICLVDEFAAGLHYSVHERLWSLLLDAAMRLDVQVFATTHSWDCIEGLQQAANGTPDADVNVYCLSRARGFMHVGHYNRQRLATAVREEMEVR